ncbi:hypothetical protein CCHR01_19027 [Colletotrichum chrysophilum]|uniref:Uncharacterized protein n=1 Tax=Colletotrichum chrysophilum TaxID=1836956 RepID=A0AAD9E5I0_9PEZI|nr:hypothetical protein CCHR01_19027 [Colletotrichum chrysophilum]
MAPGATMANASSRACHPLNRHLQRAVKSIDTANGQSLNPQAVRATLIATLFLLVKMQKLPELGHLHQAIESLRAETKTANENTTRDTRSIRTAMQQNTVELKENTNTKRAATRPLRRLGKPANWRSRL